MQKQNKKLLQIFRLVVSYHNKMVYICNMESLKSEKLFHTFKQFIYKDKNNSTEYEIIHYHDHIVSNGPLLPRGVDHFPGTDVSDVLHGWRHTEERLHGTSTPVLLSYRHTWHVQEMSFFVERFRIRTTVRSLSYDAEIYVYVMSIYSIYISFSDGWDRMTIICFRLIVGVNFQGIKVGQQENFISYFCSKSSDA